jgi:glycosyltransferase involved in cell wall biosynthesis
MEIAFYAPLKPPGHPVPSGDRRMARGLMAALGAAGHRVALASDLRAYLPDPQDESRWAVLESAAEAERARIGADWAREGAPDVWVCYHPYCKSPDLIGPALCERFGVAYVTVESSWSARRDLGIWREAQAHVAAGLRRAAVNICLTDRDRRGILAAVPDARVAMLAPFIEVAGFAADPAPEPGHLVVVAMLRAGDKRESFGHLAAALARLPGPWVLSVAGDGPLGDEVRGLFAGLAPGRVRWLGELRPAEVAALLARGAVYIWPGCGEAYGLAYLEAQAAGLPVVAFATAGVPEVVADGETGLLVADRDDAALAGAVGRLLGDEPLRRRMAAAARARVRRDHSMEAAVARLGGLMADVEAGGWRR